LAVSCAAIMLLFAWLHLPVLALVGLFFTVSLMSGISTVAGADAVPDCATFAAPPTWARIRAIISFVIFAIARYLSVGAQVLL
ncbi:hypothetical protein, partial [Pseudomonas aeruginosa]|uniref:hypothetical protein n=1 Tax=Pseudomonas aeruginosa TaxID=287 RepID=UPI0019692E6B